MLKPHDYDTVEAYGDYKELPVGGHICVIKQVEATTSRNGTPMLRISLDIAARDGEFGGYYADRYRRDTRENKRWGCVVCQVLQTRDGTTAPGFKGFVTSVEESNPGFHVPWGDAFAASFKGKEVGGVFGREEYIGSDGNAHWATKCQKFRSTAAIEEGVEPPADKPLKTASAASWGAPAASSWDVPMTPPPAGQTASPATDYIPISDDDLPF